MQPSSPRKPPSGAPRRRSATLLFIAVVLTAACGQNDDGAPPATRPNTALSTPQSSTPQSPSAPPAVAFTAPPPGSDPCQVTPPALAKQILGAKAKRQPDEPDPPGAPPPEYRICVYTADGLQRTLVVRVRIEPMTRAEFDGEIAKLDSDPERAKYRCEVVMGIGTSAYFCPTVIGGGSPGRLRILAGETRLDVLVSLTAEEAPSSAQEREKAVIVRSRSSGRPKAPGRRYPARSYAAIRGGL